MRAHVLGSIKMSYIAKDQRMELQVRGLPNTHTDELGGDGTGGDNPPPQYEMVFEGHGRFSVIVKARAG